MEQSYLYVLMLTASISTTIIITPFFSKLANRQDIVDHPGLHKTHDESKPLLGGLAIFFGFLLTTLIFSTLPDKILLVLVGALVLVIVGLLDDIYNLKPMVKLAGQTAAATIVVFHNYSYYHVISEYFEHYYLLGQIVPFLIVGWIVFMINAFNLIDGLDGLAVGTAAIIFAAMAVISLLNNGNPNILMLQVIGTGACIGFLFFNFNPAKIFMGDTGSMLLGYLLATTYLLSLSGSFSGSLVLGSIFIFAYPALDVTFAILRRIRNRVPIFRADKGHIHHVLLCLGFSVRKVVLLLYLLNIAFATLAVILLSLNVTVYPLIFTGVGTFVFTFFSYRFLNEVSRRNGICSAGIADKNKMTVVEE